MTDLINKIDKIVKDDIDSIKVLVKKYESVLKETRLEKDIPYLAYIIDTSINHINVKHKDLAKDWKTWSVIVIKNLYLKGKIKKEKDIANIINDFVEYYIAEYENYCEDIISATNHDRDYGFVFKYENKKIGNK